MARSAEPAEPAKVKSPLEEHKTRVAALKKVAADLKKRCDSDEKTLSNITKEVNERARLALAERMAEEDAEIRKAEQVLKDPQSGAGEIALANARKARAKNAQDAAKALIDKLGALAEIEKTEAKITALAAKVTNAEKVQTDTESTDAEKQKATKDKAEANKDIEKEKKAKAELVKRRADDDPVYRAFQLLRADGAYCKAYCAAPLDVTPQQPINICAFDDDVLATAAVIADWPSADALIETLGVPRRRLESAFGSLIQLEVPELPGDPFAKSRAPLPAEAFAPEQKKGDGAAATESTDTPPECKSTEKSSRSADRSAAMRAASATAGSVVGTGLGGVDLTAVSAQTAEVALAALAKVIEDRAKRELLVWFLQKMQEGVCGAEEEVCHAPDDPAVKGAWRALEEKRASWSEQRDNLRKALESERQAEVALKSACDTEKEKKGRGTEEERNEATPNREKSRETLNAARNEREKNRKIVEHLAGDIEALEKELVVERSEGACTEAAAVRREVRSFWLPTTCALAARRMDYVQYGGGGSLMRALQGAVATDVRNWPGVAAGVAAAAPYWATTSHGAYPDEISDLFRCAPKSDDESQDPVCVPTVQLRRVTAKLIGQIQGGANPLASLQLYGTAINDLNVTETGNLHNVPYQLAACIASLPQAFQANSEKADATTDADKDKVRALFLAGLASAPACFTVVGEGWSRDECKVFSPGTGDELTCESAGLKKANSKTPNLERLTTLVRWNKATGVVTDRVVSQWGVVQTSWETFFAAFEALKKSGGGQPFVPPTFDPQTVNNAQTFAEVLAAFDAYVKDTTRAAQQTEQVKLLQASAGLARASLDLGVAITGGLVSVSSVDLYPGLGLGSGDLDALKKALEDTSKQLGKMSQYVATAESALNGDWGALVAKVVEIVRNDLQEKCKADAECARLVDKLARYSGLFSALVSEKDPEKVAEALDAAAMPIGGWRLKQIPGSETLSITALPGFGIGAEYRWGQYGAVYEKGNRYWAPPTLQLPVGLDFALATGNKAFPSVGFFLPVLDPAGYLNYDPDKGGRLPGAQLLTALCFGASARVHLGESPIALMGSVFWRPNFRAWESDITSPGANVLQVQGSVVVDVTLFELWSKRPF